MVFEDLNLALRVFIATGLVFMLFQLISKLYKHTQPRIGFLKIIFCRFFWRENTGGS